MFVSLFSAGAYSSRRSRDLLRALSVVLSMGVLLNFLVGESSDIPGNVALFRVFSLLLNIVFYGAAWLMGDMWRTRLEDRQELARRAAVLEEQKGLLAVRAVAEQRLRIARELHDIVGHHLSVMGVQAGAARRTLGVDRARTEDLLASIESSGRQAVTEMSRLVGLLRDPTEHPTTPQPTLEDLDGLVDTMADAGLQVAVHRVGKPQDLDTATDLSVFRIVQESLTNALRHGSQPRAVVEVTYLVDHLRVRVRNAANGATSVEGRGLVGMVERASLVGGMVTAGTGPDGWFEVVGTFPYGRF
ncbi:hypothetical protein BH23ACT5_BH23ACT5_18680 [soil metagenome]